MLNLLGYRDRVSKRRIIYCICCVWMLSACISFPAIFWWRASSPHLYTDRGRCLFTDDAYYVVFSAMISFYIPLAEMVFQFSEFFDVERWRSTIKAGILEGVLSAKVSQSNCANPLFAAALNGHLKAVEILLENKAEYLRETLEITNGGKTTRHLEVVRRLLKMKGTDPNEGAKLRIAGKAITGLSPLCIVTSESICNLLIENKANVNQQMGNGQTPLFCACIRGNLEIVKCLFANGAEVNAVDKLGRTPLMAAAFHGHAGLVRYLLEKGARIDLATNEGGRTAQNFAKSENGEIAKMLREAAQRTAESERHNVA
uniref:G_PROTEIN_RECEP_F1_2 domain-containing protein n=1 Tax=Globodera pallida TaxID=36090 RepID=A0A183BTU2_GLOPA